jgi:hypothetical protein
VIELQDIPPLNPGSDKWYWFEWSETELNGATITNAIWTPAGGLVVNETAIIGRLTGARLSVLNGAEFEVIHLQIENSNNENLNGDITIEISTKGH